MGMSDRRAWTLMVSLNASLTTPLAAARPGGTTTLEQPQATLATLHF